MAVKESHINPFDISLLSYRHFGGWLKLITLPRADCCDRLKPELSRSVKMGVRKSSWHRLVRSVGSWSLPLVGPTGAEGATLR